MSLSKDLEKYILQNKPLAQRILQALDEQLTQETERLHEAAEKALVLPDVRNSALMLLGRVSFLREIVTTLRFLLKEQTHG